MAFTNFDNYIAALPATIMPWSKVTSATGATNTWIGTWAQPGVPGAGSLSIGNTTTGVIPTSATAGAWVLPTPGGGQHLYFAQFHAHSLTGVAGIIAIYDRLWHAGSFAMSSASISLSPTALTRETGGLGVEAWLEMNTASSTSTNVTLSYTNTAGTAGQSTAALALTSSIKTNFLVPFTLASGDMGVKSIQSITLSNTTNTGTFNLILMRRLTFFSFTQATNLCNGGGFDPFDTGLALIDPNACLTINFISTGSGSVTLLGTYGMVTA